METDRSKLIAEMGGDDAVRRLTSEAKAEALEQLQQRRLNESLAAVEHRFPTVAELQEKIETRSYRLGTGFLFLSDDRDGRQRVKRLEPMPEKPTLADFFRLRFNHTANHVLQSANLARKNGMSEEVILACLLHDVSQELIRVDHGWWSAHMFEPYVSEKVAFAIRYHQALRFYADPAVGYEYPDLYREVFGEDYKPEPYIEEAYRMVRAHKWYDLPRMVTVNDLYSFEPGVVVKLEEFTDIIGRHFKQPKEGLGFDNTAVAHVWRSVAAPDRTL